MRLFTLLTLFTVALVISRPTKTADSCYFDEDGNMVCVSDPYPDECQFDIYRCQ